MRIPETWCGPLFRHDSLITINTVRRTFVRWDDRLIAATMLLVALAAIRAGFADRPWEIAAWMAFGASIIIGAGVGRVVAARLDFHAFDGPLPADALYPSTRRRYLIASHSVGLAILIAITLTARPSLLIVSGPTYLVGVLTAHATSGLAIPYIAPSKARPKWMLLKWLRSPAAGIIAATILLLSLLPASTIGTNALIAIVGIEAVLIALTLTMIDDVNVRFMTVVGHPAWRIVVYHLRSLLPFAGVTIPICWLAFGPLAVGVLSAASVAVLFLLVMRILAYRIHGKRFADLLVSILVGLLILVGYAMPVGLPFVAIAILWHLQRRGRTKMWLLA